MRRHRRRRIFLPRIGGSIVKCPGEVGPEDLEKFDDLLKEYLGEPLEDRAAQIEARQCSSLQPRGSEAVFQKVVCGVRRPAL